MKRITYLDNAATSYPKPKRVASVVAKTIETIAGSPGRGVHRQAITTSRILFNTRLDIAKLLKLKNPERIIFTKNATEGINIALKGLLKKGDEVAISALEHNAVIRTLTTLKKKGVRVRYAPPDKNGLPDPTLLPKVKMLITTGASNVTGAIAKIKALGHACKTQKILFFVDAAQTAGSLPFDTSNIDILACTGHKGLLGPQGTGFVWFAEGLSPTPLLDGGTGSESELADMPGYWPDRFEAGTMNTPGIAGLHEGIKYLLTKGVKTVREHEMALNKIALEMLMNESRIIVYPPFDTRRRASLISFNVKGMDPAEVGDLLDRRGIAVRVGLHCAPHAHKFTGTFPEGTIRISPGALTTRADIKRFTERLHKILKCR